MGIEIKKRESFLELRNFFVTDVDDDVGFSEERNQAFAKDIYDVLLKMETL